MKLLKIYLGSAEIKRKIVERSVEFNIPLAYICGEIGIEYNALMKSYINVLGISRLEITEEQFEKMLSILGISVRHQFVIETDYDGKEVSKALNEKYERIKNIKKFNGSKEKRDITSTS